MELSGVLEIFYILVEVVVIWIIHVKTHQIIHRKWMHFIVCKLHLNKVGF